MAVNRFSAFAIHLLLSLLVFSSLVAVMYFYWFPGELFFMDGGWEGIKLVAMVDLVLGPLLTLCLFKRGKPSLVFDMSVIAAIQIGALAYGFHATYNQRIVALVYADHRFNTLTATEYAESSERLLTKGIEPAPLERFGQELPVTVFTKPIDADSYGKYLESIFNDYPEIRERSDQYLDVSSHYAELQTYQLTEAELAMQNRADVVREQLAAKGFDAADVALFPLKARYESGLAVIDPTNHRIVGILRHPALESLESNRISVSDSDQ